MSKIYKYQEMVSKLEAMNEFINTINNNYKDGPQVAYKDWFVGKKWDNPKYRQNANLDKMLTEIIGPLVKSVFPLAVKRFEKKVKEAAKDAAIEAEEIIKAANQAERKRNESQPIERT